MALTPPFNSMPLSLEDMLRSMQGGPTETMPMPVSDPGVAPLPEPMPTPAPAPMAPSGAKPGPDFGGILQKTLPMLMAFLANKKGGPLAGAGLLDGLTEGLARKRKAEQDAHELELQTINDEAVRQERTADRQRQQQVQRASWLTNLQTQLAQINDPVAFASTLDLADKVGASAFGFQPGELKSTFRFPKERETAAAQSEASALLDKLKKTHGDNLSALMQSNALVTFRGKQTPLRDVMAAAGVLASDDKGAPILPSAGDDFQIPNSDAGFDFRVELAAEEERLGRKLKPGERSALRRRLVSEEETRLRGRRPDPAPRSEPVVVIQTVDAEGRPVTQVLPRSQAVGQSFAARPTAGQQQQMSELEAGIDQISSIRESFDPSWVGPVAGRANQAKLSVPGVPVDQRMASFFSNVASLKNEIIRLITGAAVGVQEAERLMREIPDITNKPEVFLARLENTARNRQRLLDQMRERSGGGRPAPSTGGPAVGERRMINGQMGEWDGRGWKPVSSGRGARGRGAGPGGAR